MKHKKEQLTEFFQKIWSHIQTDKHHHTHKNLNGVTFEKIRREIDEHFSFFQWFFSRLLVPLAAFYIVLGIVLKINILNSLFFGLLIFIYSNFLPDFDTFFKISKTKRSKSYQKYALLFFAPIYVYYFIFEKAKPLYSKKPKTFHNLKSMLIYGLFLFILGIILYGNFLEPTWLALFGIMGYLIHLGIDNMICWD